MRAGSLTIAFLTFGLLALACHTAQASKRVHFSGAELIKMCSSTYDTDYGFCAGYVSAVSNLLLTESVSGFRACKHASVRSQQSIDLFRSYAEIFPETLREEAQTVVAGALARAFPCQQD